MSAETNPETPPVEELFRELHQKLVQHLIARISDGEPSGEVLRQARELLRDNSITDAGRAHTPLHQLSEVLERLPFNKAE